MKNGNGTHLLTPSEACAMAGVGATTLKRWADAGLLAHIKTAGGHRRFPREELERFLGRQTQLGQTGSSEGSPWLARLIGGPAHEVEAELLFARSRLGSWHAVADELGAVLREIGLRWQNGQLTILDEHIVAERLSRALARVGEALPSRPGAPRALLACLETDEHSLGLSLTELCLRELGWTTLWAGPRTPLLELERILDPGQGNLQVELLALSASSHSDDAAALELACRTLETRCAARGVAMAVGGEGAWPEAPRRARRFHDFLAFHRFLLSLAPSAF